MAGSLNKRRFSPAEVVLLYSIVLLSIPEISRLTDIPRSSVRTLLKKQGVALRSSAQGAHAYFATYGSPHKGKPRAPFSESWKENIAKSCRRWAELNAKGVSLKPNGYLEITRGEHKGRGVHVVKIEERIGRRLARGECVHHIDGDSLNNSSDNLMLMTLAEHSRLHRLEEFQLGITRKRDENGKFC